MKPGYELGKRALDIAFCLLLVPVAVPVVALCCLAVWLNDPGPVFYAQERTGRGGRRFRMFKLRTMVTDADKLKESLAHRNQRTGPDFKIDDDPRITKIGRWLRRTSLDELPQLFSVLNGDMSLVGPRPTSFTADKYSLWHTERLEVRPGITGLWQIQGRGDSDFNERVRLDIEYIENRSMSYDLWILARTVGPVVSGRGAT